MIQHNSSATGLKLCPRSGESCPIAFTFGLSTTSPVAWTDRGVESRLSETTSMTVTFRSMNPHPISAYIPCFNNAASLAQVIESLRHQTLKVNELFVVDDGSSDSSCAIAGQLGVRVIRHERNLGRGAVRARAMEEAAHDLVLSCDATNVLSADFCERAHERFSSPKVAAVFGRMSQHDHRSVVSRWRGRHMFKMETTLSLDRHAVLTTWGLMMRRSTVVEVGNFDPRVRHTEDIDLGERLLGAGYEVVFDPDLTVTSIVNNSLREVLDRYWRWYAGKDERVSWRGYVKQIVFALKVMAAMDLRAGDPLSLPITLFSPHYQFWRSYIRKFQAMPTRSSNPAACDSSATSP